MAKAPAPAFKDTNYGSPSALIAEARKRWNRCSEYEDPQRAAILEAKKFRAGDQWPEAIKVAREGGNAIAGQPAQPPRPCFVVDRISQPLRSTINVIKNGSFGFDVLPNGKGADEGTADILNGYLRRVVNQAQDEAPVVWAAEGAAEGGLGWFRLLTDYVHETWDGPPDPSMYDQELRMARITNNLTVYCDPSAVRPTRSDALFMFVTQDMDKDEFKSRWKDADMRGLEDFAATGDPSGWVTKDQIRIAEYWRIEFEEMPVYQLRDGTAGIGEPPKGADVLQKRVFRKPIVKGSKINACEELEQMAWVGSRIPLIPILGEELNVDGKCVLRGMIQEAMDAQRMVNYSYSAGIEGYALASKSPIIAAAGQIDNYKEIWQTANIYNWAYLPYDPVSISGTIVPPPNRDEPDFSKVQVALGLMAKSEECVAATTSYFDPTDADLSPAQRTGVAIQSMQGQAENGNSHYPKNAQRAMLYAANLMLEVIPKITRPGQILHILGEDDEPAQVIAGQPFTTGANGVPIPASPDITPEMAKLQGSLHKFYDLNNGIYAVTVTLGKGTATRQQEGSQALGALIPHLPPEMAAVATPDYVEQLSFPGAHQIAEKLRKTLPPQLQDQDAQPTALPPQVQAMVSQLQQENQQLKMAIATKQPEIQGKLQQTQLQEQAETQRADADRQAGLEKVEIQAAASMANAQAKVDAENFRSYVDSLEQKLSKALDLHMAHTHEVMGQIHEAIQNSAQRTHEVKLAQMPAPMPAAPSAVPDATGAP